MSDHKWKELKAQMSPESQARVDANAKAILAEMLAETSLVLYHTCGKQAAPTASAAPLNPPPQVPCMACAKEGGR